MGESLTDVLAPQPPVPGCKSCLSGIWAFLDLKDSRPSGEAINCSFAQSSGTECSFPTAEILSTELPPGWGRSQPSGMRLQRPVQDKAVASPSVNKEQKPRQLGKLKVVASNPAFLECIQDDQASDSEREGSGSPLYCSTSSVMPPRTDEQHVLLRPTLPDGDEHVVQAATLAKASIVFVAAPSEGESEFPLRRRPDIDASCWSISVRETKLPPGMYRFYFVLNNARVLSSAYPIIGDTNVAIFSDSLRRYIVGHSEKDSFDSDTPAKKMSSLLMKPAKEERSMKRRTTSYSLGLHNIGMEDGENSCGKPQQRRNQKALFSNEIFAGLYDTELPLRLHPSLLRGLEWGSASSSAAGADMQLWAGSARLGKMEGKCEDACFVSNFAVGVADGVGGMSAYEHFGVNSAKLAAELMSGAKSACHAILDDSSDTSASSCALKAMWKSEGDAESFGASTMTVATLRHGKLGVANLGDSGFMILRRGRKHKLEIVERSTEQHHRWNCPYQVTRLPPELSKRFPGFACDTPDVADTYLTTVQEGDLVLVFTDGLRDNLHDREILHVAECALPPCISQLTGLPDYKTAPDSVAKALALAAFERSCDPKATVPFARGCRSHGYDFEGGKEDDITVVAAWVIQTPL